MAEYVERAKALMIIDEVHGARSAYHRVQNLPAADVSPVVRAEWVVCGDGEDVPWMCSHCGKTTAHKYKTMYGKYCPNCGARMIEEDK